MRVCAFREPRCGLKFPEYLINRDHFEFRIKQFVPGNDELLDRLRVAVLRK